MIKKVTTLFVSALLLFGCSNKIQTTSNNADSYTNTKSTSGATEKANIDSNEVSKADGSTDSGDEIDPDFSVDEVPEETTENSQIAYSDGAFEILHRNLMEKYDIGYQSFSGESLLDIYGDDSNIEYFEDAIGLISQTSYNQLFVFEGYSKNIESFCENLIDPITEDPDIEDVEWKTYDIGDDIKVLCIGEEDFMTDTEEIINNSIGGDLND